MSATLQSITEQFAYWSKADLPAALPQSEALRVIVGCGTSYNLATSVAAAMNSTGRSAIAVPAGEWISRPDMYCRAPKIDVIALSRSGESTETVEAARLSRQRGHYVIGVTCAPGSGLSANSDTAIEFDTHPEEGIVMTASASLMLLAGFALAGVDIGEDIGANAETLMKRFAEVPASDFCGRTHFVFLGGGVQYGAALEGALKLQEMALCYTQAFHPGEYRHGPVSLADERTAIVMLYSERTQAEEAALAAELRQKGAWVLGLGGPGDVELPQPVRGDAGAIGVLPTLQLLGERYAVEKGIDTTAPRNLTKVVVLNAK